MPDNGFDKSCNTFTLNPNKRFQVHGFEIYGFLNPFVSYPPSKQPLHTNATLHKLSS